MIYSKENFPDLPGSWDKILVGLACNNISVREKTQAKHYKVIGRLPIVDQGAGLVGGYTDDIGKSVTDKLPVVVFGDHTRAIKFIDFAFAAGADGIKVLEPKEFLLPKLFFRFLQALKLPDKGYARHFQHLRASYIAVPPLNEQKRIADKLDAVVARVDACREHLDRVPAILKRFRQAVLGAATSGQLTEEWRQAQRLDQWLDLPLSQVASIIDPNPSHRYPSYEKGTVPIIATEQFEGRDGYDVSKAKLVNQSFYQERMSAHGFLPHDIVFARKGRLGLARRLPKLEKFVFSHTIFLIRCYEPSHSNYILWYLRNDKCIEWLLQEMHSNQGVPTLGKSFMERLPIRLPPMAEQLEIVRRVEALFAYADSLEARYRAARNQVERLTPALLAKAFRGELVPQDPNDEPASVLLERIRAARTEQLSKRQELKPRMTKPSRNSKEKSIMAKSRFDDDVKGKPYLASLLGEIGGNAKIEDLFKRAELPVVDFYKQLAWEVENGHILDSETRLEVA